VSGIYAEGRLEVIRAGEMPSNPFSALERQNFPEFSPVFTKTRTPSSAEVHTRSYVVVVQMGTN